MNHSVIAAYLLLWKPWKTKTSSMAWKIGTSTSTSSLRSTCRNSHCARTCSLTKTASTVASRWSAVTNHSSKSEAATNCSAEQLQFPKRLTLLYSFSSNSPFPLLNYFNSHHLSINHFGQGVLGNHSLHLPWCHHFGLVGGHRVQSGFQLYYWLWSKLL